MSAFDFTGNYPVPLEDEDDLFGHRLEGDLGLNDRVDCWMSVRGFTREEAEQRVLTDLMDDAA